MTPAKPQEAPATASPAAAIPAKPAPKVTRLDGGTIAVADLHAALFHWDGETVVVSGYPALFMSPAAWPSRLTLGAEAKAQAKTLLECPLANPPSGKLASDTKLVVRGTFRSRSFAVPSGEPPLVRLADCEVVSSGTEPESVGDPWTLDANPVPVADLHQAVFGWLGKTVRVSGYFKGSTHSSADDITRHQLKAGTSGSTLLDCKQAGKTSAPPAVLTDRSSAVVEGVLAAPVGSTIALDQCGWME